MLGKHGAVFMVLSSGLFAYGFFLVLRWHAIQDVAGFVLSVAGVYLEPQSSTWVGATMLFVVGSVLIVGPAVALAMSPSVLAAVLLCIGIAIAVIGAFALGSIAGRRKEDEIAASENGSPRMEKTSLSAHSEEANLKRISQEHSDLEAQRQATAFARNEHSHTALPGTISALPDLPALKLECVEPGGGRSLRPSPGGTAAPSAVTEPFPVGTTVRELADLRNGARAGGPADDPPQANDLQLPSASELAPGSALSNKRFECSNDFVSQEHADRKKLAVEDRAPSCPTCHAAGCSQKGHPWGFTPDEDAVLHRIEVEFAEEQAENEAEMDRVLAEAEPLEDRPPSGSNRVSDSLRPEHVEVPQKHGDESEKEHAETNGEWGRFVDAARVALRENVAQVVAEAELTAAGNSGDQERLRQAIEAAKHAGVDRDKIGAAERLLVDLAARWILQERKKSVAAEAELVAAQQDTDIDRLRKAIEAAKDVNIGPDICSVAEEVLANLEAQASQQKRETHLAAEEELAAASRSSEPERLSAAIEAAKNAGVNPETVAAAQDTLADLVVAVARSQRDARLTAESELAAAAREADPGRLRCMLSVAAKAGVDPEALAAGERSLAQMEARFSATALATDELATAAAQAPIDMERLLKAVATAEEVGGVPEALVALASKALAAEERRLEAGRNLRRTRLARHQAAREEIIAAIERKDELGLRAALAKGRVVGSESEAVEVGLGEGGAPAFEELDPQLAEAAHQLAETIGDAQRELAQMDLQAAARGILKAATESKVVDGIHAALQAATTAGLSSECQEVVEGRIALEELDARAVARSELMTAMEAAEADRVWTMCAAAKSAGVSPRVVEAAESWLAGQESRTSAIAAATSWLETAMGKASEAPEELHAALRAAEELGGVAEAVLDAAAAALSAERLRLREKELGIRRTARELAEAAIDAGEELGLRAALGEIARMRMPSGGFETSMSQWAASQDEFVDMDAALAEEGRQLEQALQGAEEALLHAKVRAATLRGLEVAVASGKAEDLREALKNASRRSSLGGEHAQVHAAQVALLRAERADAAKGELADAVKFAVPERLRHAIDSAKSLGVEPEAVAAAERSLEALEAHTAAATKAAAELEDAIGRAGETPERLFAALRAADEFGNEVPKELRDRAAAALVGRLGSMQEAVHAKDVAKEAAVLEERRRSAREELRKAANTGPDADWLRKALKEAENAGVDCHEECMAEARRCLAQAEPFEAALKELRASIDAGANHLMAHPRDADGLEAASNRIMSALIEARQVGFKDSAHELEEAALTRRKLHNAMQDLKGATRVFCRVRPLISREVRLQEQESVTTQRAMSVEVCDHDKKTHRYEFDAAFGFDSDQSQIFEECRSLVTAVLDGYNATIFAYGQTGSGKTYTMMGQSQPPELKGICPRTIEALFASMERRKDRFHHKVQAHMLEIYCAKVTDLGAQVAQARKDASPQARGLKRTNSRTQTHSKRPSSCGTRKHDGGNEIKVHVVDGHVTIDGVEEFQARSAGDLLALLEDGNRAKRIRATAMNPGSSRSHTILGITVSSTNRDTKEVWHGKCLLVDLAGSERLKQCVSAKEQREAIEINKSLTALGDVISAVTTGRRAPYRNHVLTEIMMDSVGGTAKALLVACVSPAKGLVQETKCCLDFATRAKTITRREAAVLKLQSVRRGQLARSRVKQMRGPPSGQ